MNDLFSSMFPIYVVYALCKVGSPKHLHIFERINIDACFLCSVFALLSVAVGTARLPRMPPCVRRRIAPRPSVRPTAPGSVHVVIGKMYIMELEFPAVLNSKSPIAPSPWIEDWRTANSQRTGRFNIRAVRRRFGVVLSWDPSTNVVVVLVGTKAPGQAHRYVPFYRTTRLPQQTTEVLIPSPRDAFTTRPSYLNFSHAIRVVVVQAGDGSSSSVPTQSYFVDVPPNFGAVTLSAPEIAKLRALHEGYWTGLRYTDDGGSYYLGAGGVGGAGGGSGGGGADDYEESKDGGEDFV